MGSELAEVFETVGVALETVWVRWGEFEKVDVPLEMAAA